VSGRYFCGDLPAVCTHVIPLAEAGTSANGYACAAAKLSAKQRSPANPAAPATPARKHLRDRSSLSILEAITAVAGLPEHLCALRSPAAEQIPAPRPLFARCAHKQ